MKTQELNQNEQNQTNGGGILGGGDDRNMFTAISQGFANASSTDDDGDTESTNLDFGTGSLFESESDD